MNPNPSAVPGLVFPDLGAFGTDSGLVPLERTTDGRFRVGSAGVTAVATTGDRTVEFAAFEDHTLACVVSALGYPAYYPVHPVDLERPIEAVLMDLDGTTVQSEHFWIWMIQLSTASLLDDPGFEFEEADLPHVSGRGVSEHLGYSIRKYCPDKTVEEARRYYFEHTRREMQAVLDGGGRGDAFTPTEGLKDFLLELKEREVRIALVTSGLHEKAWPEILSVFRALDMGDPLEFYDAIVTGGFPARRGVQTGTLGELSPKPHPWLYAEAARVGLGFGFERRGRVVGIDDSGAGVCSIRLAGFTAVGFGGGNIDESGTQALCGRRCESLEQVLEVLIQ